MSDPLPVRHLLLRMRPIHRALRGAAKRQEAIAARLDRPDLAPHCITDRQVFDLLDDADHLIDGGPLEEPTAISPEELALESNYREGASELGRELPLDRLATCPGLTPFELDVILLCSAAELDHGYERIFAYILDDLRRIHPCVELACHLSARSSAERLARRHCVGRFGRLRRCGLIEAFGEPTTELRTPLRLGPGVLEFLCGLADDALALWNDPTELGPAEFPDASVECDPARVERLGRSLARREVDAVGLWGQSADRTEDVARAIAHAAGLPLRRLPMEQWAANPASLLGGLREALLTASALGAAVLVPVDALCDGEHRIAAGILSEALARCDLPCVLTGQNPWRPTNLLAARAYAEIDLPGSDYPARRALWDAALPGVDRGHIDSLAGRFRMSRQEVRAASNLARTQARIESNGKPVTVEDRLDGACASVARKSSSAFVSLVKPRRGPDDLILAPDVHRQVVEIAGFSRALPRVAEAWGFGRLATGGTGIKALFTGDPGTGKTLAAEVIAGQLAVPLLKVNIGQSVSKWIGETEKNLDEAFAEAAACHAVLFIDEADGLCGRRGEVRHASDRFANTEVSHLLQKLEDHDGLVILASNLKENLDPAFLRRFHVVIPFARPAVAERLRLWDLAFPAEAPLSADVDRTSLARLDMTGAAIVGAARTAALMAADRRSSRITMAHVVQGVVRQYRREGRVLTPTELGPHAALIREV